MKLRDGAKANLGSDGAPVKERAKRKRKASEVNIKPFASISVYVICNDGLARRRSGDQHRTFNFPVYGNGSTKIQ